MEHITKLGVTNTVYKAPFNLNVEIMRYFLIKKKFGLNPTLKKTPDMILSAFNYFYENIGKYATDEMNGIKHSFPKDPFLFHLPLKSNIIKYYKSYELYNSIVDEILEELEEIKSLKESILKTKSIKIIIKSSPETKSVLFEIVSGKKKLFRQNLSGAFALKFEKYKKYKYQMLAALLRYDILGFLGNASAAEAPEKYEKLKKEGYNMELFGSFYNVHMDNYFGLFYDLEYHFGCLGNLFSAELNYGKFVCNPPFQINTMNHLVKFLLKNHERRVSKKNSKELIVHITVPVWYKKDREKLGKLETYSENAEFHKELLEPYIIEDKIYLQKDYKFYIYLTGKYEGLCDVNIFTVKL